MLTEATQLRQTVYLLIGLLAAALLALAASNAIAVFGHDSGAVATNLAIFQNQQQSGAGGGSARMAR